MTTKYLQVTPLIDYQEQSIEQLIEMRQWRTLSSDAAIKQVYDYVRDEIKFGYNRDDAISASEVLGDGYGQCNTKGTLLMALLRALGIACRFHGFTIYNALQRGAIPNYLMPFAPKRILHSWVEVLIRDVWINLEGFIVDQVFLSQVQAGYSNCKSFSGYAIAVPDLQNPNNKFMGQSTYIQADGIADDLGLFNAPDDFFAKHGSNMHGLKKFAYQYVLRKLINRNLNKIRKFGLKT
ncbi:transglutaminase family protein [Alginatibacterium sediminis]|uniref:Transglutaminase family protein n=1 Tax=Alginatibacterium sediminis TaxID=2164068 RepID=A0A420EHR0_9ALTE|nr:transglutaminase family protein [Alginatibacterium sediminis]RKF20096.1 transglutaminase family protein [Alginatibacterium sediminis]